MQSCEVGCERLHGSCSQVSNEAGLKVAVRLNPRTGSCGSRAQAEPKVDGEIDDSDSAPQGLKSLWSMWAIKGA